MIERLYSHKGAVYNLLVAEQKPRAPNHVHHRGPRSKCGGNKQCLNFE